MTVIALEYWPAIRHVAQWYNSPEAELSTGGTYQKQSGMNRCRIAGVRGVLTLSVPLISGREQKSLYSEVRIDNSQRWAIQQLRSLRSCYGKAPFFEYYFPTIEKILQTPVQYLQELNDTILQQLIFWLNWKGHLMESAAFFPVAVSSSTSFPSYLQVFADRQPFLPNLSILDLLFCLGPASRTYLQQFHRYNNQ